jgi:hypothetical protein
MFLKKKACVPDVQMNSCAHLGCPDRLIPSSLTSGASVTEVISYAALRLYYAAYQSERRWEKIPLQRLASINTGEGLLWWQSVFH